MKDFPHESVLQHVTGTSAFIGDLYREGSMLYGKLVYSTRAHARLLSVDTTAAEAVPGVRAVLLAAGIPGENQVGAVAHDEPCLAADEVGYIGQAIVLIAAENRAIACQAASLVNISYETLPACLTLGEAMTAGQMITPERLIRRGDPESGFAASEHLMEGTLETGPQEHWYLERQCCLAVPGEGGEMNIFASTQHPSETQAIVAGVLGLARNQVIVEVRRMGGAFGGKETQANPVSAWAALLAHAAGQAVFLELSREEDQVMTGKRHPFKSMYKVGYQNDGKINAYQVELNGDAGYCLDLSGAILDRAVFHADNAYYLPHVEVRGRMWRTNHPPNTAFRGFGGPQGMAVIEQVIDRIARHLKMDPLVVRKINLYREGLNLTHYGQEVEDNHLPVILEELEKMSDYHARRKEIQHFNQNNKLRKKGLALTPVKFGISFTTTFLNQAAALVHIYQDGSVMVSHGGTEMGQGLHAKILAIAARELGVSPRRIRIAPTNTSRVPNTSATAASSGADLNGMAVKNAIGKLRQRILQVVAPLLSIHEEAKEEDIQFINDQIVNRVKPHHHLPFTRAVEAAYKARVSLSATGYYRTPGIHYDPLKGRGHPFYYFAFGAAVSEVLLDLLTARAIVSRVDILHDTGLSLDASIDKGQVAGGFIQGLGWCTSEVIKWDDAGQLLNRSPDTYKIPTMGDLPAVFNIELLNKSHDISTIHGSKAVGEPPFMLAFSAWLAIKDALSAAAGHRYEPDFSLPASTEMLLTSLHHLREKTIFL